MPKYLVEASYTAEGLKSLQKDKATGRHRAWSEAVEAMGGKVESFHFALGEHDVVTIVDLPDISSVAAICMAASSSGLVRTRTTALMTVEEADRALGHKTKYRAPGK